VRPIGQPRDCLACAPLSFILDSLLSPLLSLPHFAPGGSPRSYSRLPPTLRFFVALSLNFSCPAPLLQFPFGGGGRRPYNVVRLFSALRLRRLDENGLYGGGQECRVCTGHVLRVRGDLCETS
jgi:hypothetical protein